MAFPFSRPITRDGQGLAVLGLLGRQIALRSRRQSLSRLLPDFAPSAISFLISTGVLINGAIQAT